MDNKQLSIDIISDVVCPWCIIGFGRLQQAIEQLQTAHSFDVSLSWHPFELNPDMAKSGANLRDHLANKYGTTIEGSIEARAMISKEGNKVGFRFNYFDEMKILNTFDCHQLLLWAKDTQEQTPLALAFFAHFFTHRGEFSRQELLTLVDEVGLDSKAANKVLDEQRFAKDIRALEQHWQNLNIHGVPVFIFNGAEVLTGAQEVSTFERVINDLIRK